MTGDFVDAWKLLGAIAADRKLPKSVAAVAYWMLDYLGDGGMYLGTRSIHEMTGLDPRTIERAKTALLDAGYFKRARKGGGRRRSSIFVPNFEMGRCYHAVSRGKLHSTPADSPGLDRQDPDEGLSEILNSGEAVQKHRSLCPDTPAGPPEESICINPPTENPPEELRAARFAPLEGAARCALEPTNQQLPRQGDRENESSEPVTAETAPVVDALKAKEIEAERQRTGAALRQTRDRGRLEAERRLTEYMTAQGYPFLKAVQELPQGFYPSAIEAEAKQPGTGGAMLWEAVRRHTTCS